MAEHAGITRDLGIDVHVRGGRQHRECEEGGEKGCENGTGRAHEARKQAPGRAVVNPAAPAGRPGLA